MNTINWQVWSDWPYAVQFVSVGVLTSLLTKLLKSPAEQLKYSPLSEAKETIFSPFTKLNLLFKEKKKVVYYCAPEMSEETHRKRLAHMIFLCGLFFFFFPCLQVWTELLLFGTQQKEVSCAQHDLVWPIKWKWISSLHIKFCWIPFAQESKIAVSCSPVMIHFPSGSLIPLFLQILKFLPAVTLQISHSYALALQRELL